MSKKLLTDLLAFAETTSVHGIRRVTKAKTRVTFVLWLVAVMTCTALLVWQLSVVLTRYFQYPVSTLTVQAPAWETPTFPDITICNIDSAPLSVSDANNIIAWMNNSFLLTMNDGGYNGGTMNGFFLPIFSAYYFDTFEETSYTFTIEVSATWNPTYILCFTLKPPNTSLRGNICSFIAVLYVDRVSDEVNKTISIFPDASGAVGMRLLVHPPGTAPDMTLGMNIDTGLETDILLTQSVRTRLGPPYSNCTDQQHLTGDNTSATYTQPYCVNTCIQKQIVDRCGCVSESLPQYTMTQRDNVNFHICEYSANYSTIILSCISPIIFSSNIPAECRAACVLPCSQLQYDAAMSLGPWPRPAELDEYSYYFLSDPRFLPLFNISANANQEETIAATTTSAATEFFKSRFLQLNVEFGSQSFIELKDVAAFTIDAMGAQMGGVLNLWLGVTVMFAFEAFGFLYIYLTNSSKKTTQACRTSLAPAVETKSSANSTQMGQPSTTPSAETELSHSVVNQIE